MIEEPDIWRAAKILVDRYGSEAGVEATLRADKYASEGDMEGRAVWLRILKAVDALLSKVPPPHANVH